jgi:hypothetical protein
LIASRKYLNGLMRQRRVLKNGKKWVVIRKKTAEGDTESPNAAEEDEDKDEDDAADDDDEDDKDDDKEEEEA